jgi:DNA polymerase-4
VTRLWGVGEATRSRSPAQAATIGDVARYGVILVARLGGVAAAPAALARGGDPPVVAERDPVTVGHQETFDDDVSDKGELAMLLLDQADRVAARLRAADLRARAVVLTVKYDDFRQITRRTTLAAPTSDGGVLARTAIDLLQRVTLEPRKGCRARLCGLSATEPGFAMRRASSASMKTRAPAASGSARRSTSSPRSSGAARSGVRSISPTTTEAS